jgi:hypothetical protein
MVLRTPCQLDLVVQALRRLERFVCQQDRAVVEHLVLARGGHLPE